jgi:[amino group carrier protein]-lysine/ornithine hydrolase
MCWQANQTMNDFETLTGLVSKYSPSGKERGAVEWLTARMQSLGYDDAYIDTAGNAVGVVGKGHRQVVLLGHIDTVPGEIPVRRENRPPHEFLHGRGTVDAKGPLACFVDAVARVGTRQGWQFVVIGAVEEERNSEGARFAVRQYTPDFAILGEPNHWDRLALGYKGSAWASLTVKRGQTHTASITGTASEAAIDLWLKLREFSGFFNTGRQKVFDQLLLTLRDMTSEASDYEQRAQLTVGARLPVDLTPDAWYEKLSLLAQGIRVEPIGFAVPAWRCEKNTQLVRAFLSGIRVHGGEPRFVYKTGTSDLNIVAPVWNCPALVYGPGDSSLDHTPEEYIDLNEYSKSVTVLSHVLQNLQ